MIVINIPVDRNVNVSLPPEPRPRPRPTLDNNAPSPGESLPSSSGSSTPGSGLSSSRRLSRRVQSMALANLLSNDPSKPIIAAKLSAARNGSTSDLKALEYDLPADIAVPPFGRPSKDVDRDLARLYEAVSGARRIAVICGAGISVSSPANIPDFRSAHGLFKKLKEKHPTAGLSSGKDLFDARLFSSESTSALFYSMVAELKRLADQAEPTIFHRFLKRLDDQGRLQRVYTQNIDGLEEKAGLSFGLGEAGDSTTTVRALGKRKRAEAGFARSKSDSHLFFHKPEDEKRPMFPRTIPLHGTLQTLTCPLCNHKLILANTVKSEEVLTGSRQGSASLGHEASKHAIELLQNGEAVPCPACQEADHLRTVAGFRSRGVGRMRVDIVLYGGQNEGAERVGQCLQRDILGLRDPNEPPVPESAAETRARERKEKKEADKLKLEQESVKKELVKKELVKEADQSIDSEAAVGLELGSFLPGGDSKDDILARAFAEQGDEKSVAIAEPVKKKPTRPPRLKPLPPDLLIVAGTSLKVPGTKRIVREFAKACHAQDEWLIYSSESEDESSNAEDGSNSKKRKPRKKPEEKEEEVVMEEDEDEEHKIHDPTTPIRTVLLNYDFPNPAREWEDVFDIWIQGDLQRAALSLFPTKQLGEDAPQDVKVIEEIVGSYTWAKFKDYLEEQRALAKKEKRNATVAATAGALGGARKGRCMGRTVSAAAKMERAGSTASVESTEVVVSSQMEVGKQAVKTKAAKARSRSESPVKKRTPQQQQHNGTAATGAKKALTGTKGGLKRSNSKKNPFLDSDSSVSPSPAFGSSTVSVDIPTIAEEHEDDETTSARHQGKVHDGGTKKQSKEKELPSSCSVPSSRCGWSRSVTMPTEPQLTVLIESQAANSSGGGDAGGKRKNRQISVKDVGVGVKPSAVYGGKAVGVTGKRRHAVSAAGVKKGRWGRTQSETACL
ncbi:related to HST4-member of the Sir2p family of NAD(+)-dependent histone deacetylases [Ustilago bromivora]|uniref:Related to HST4-member of the Sir2p family of NAD(+)-dependent histone deacetylases n=1 Tax=Ustilago bromivora TaxID=307758 RepID=A0A1K0HJQ6_9BASI|nr:related to HST4-member of the Sir2p family of NAD(+)-dependent histone deacetylases [Ustilago bromivora]